MKRVCVLLLICVCCVAAMGCKTTPRYKPADPVKLGTIPDNARLVAETSDVQTPLLFIPSADGSVYYFANDDLLATFKVSNGQRVELNAPRLPTGTQVLIDGKAVFTSNTRTGHHRFYYQPK